MTKADRDSWTRNMSKEISDWFAAQPPKFKQMPEYSRDGVDVTAIAIDEVRKTWKTNMSIIEHDIQDALWCYGRVSNIEINTCWNEPIVEVKVDISSRFNFDEICYRLSKLPWIYRVVRIDFDAMTRGMKIVIELNETDFNNERRNKDMDYTKYSSLRYSIMDFLNCQLGGAMEIKKVAFNGPATIVFWSDGTKTIVKCMEGEKFDPEKGLAMAICKRLYGNKFHKTFKDAIKNADMKCGDEAKMDRENRVLKAKRVIVRKKARAKSEK